MRFGSVCSGIEAATVAWAPLGWEASFFSEIEAFPSAVLAHRHPNVPNRGDMTKFKDWPDDAIDLLVGGTPCQSFSVAGLRAGLADPRGSLMLTYLAIAAKYRPRWLVWENVPGVLSSNEGRDFGSFLGGLGELGYGFAYRVLDAQFCRALGYTFAVPQRRRRVFVIGYFGDWRRAAAVLFDAASLRGDPAPRREAWKDVAPTISARTKGGGGLGTDFDLDGGLIQTASTGDVSHCLNAGGMGRIDYETETMIATHAIQAGALRENPNSGPDGVGVQADIAYTLEARAEVQAVSVTGEIAHTLMAEGFGASEDGAGRGIPIIAFSSKDYGADVGELSPTLRAGGHSESHANAGVPPAVVFPLDLRNATRDPEKHDAMNRQGVGVGKATDPMHTLTKEFVHGVATMSAVRRLTPVECERLQGFPDGWTDIPYRGKRAADGPRYKALGNSMAVNVMRVIGERIALVDAMNEARAAA